MKIQNTRRTKKKKNGAEVFKIIIVENFAKLMTDTKPQIQEAQRTPCQIKA